MFCKIEYDEMDYNWNKNFMLRFDTTGFDIFVNEHTSNLKESTLKLILGFYLFYLVKS